MSEPRIDDEQEESLFVTSPRSEQGSVELSFVIGLASLLVLAALSLYVPS